MTLIKLNRFGAMSSFAAVAALAVAATGALYVSFTGRPTASATTQTEREDGQGVRKSLLTCNLNLETVTAQRVSAQAQLAELGKMILPVTKLNQRMASLLTLAGESGLSVKQMLPGKAEPAQYFLRVPVELTASGNLSALTTFMAATRGKYADVAVSSFTFNRNAVPGERNRVDATILLEWHASAGESTAGEGSAQ